MKKLLISLSVIILLIAFLLYAFPLQSWNMMLHLNVFQSDCYYNNEVQQQAPFEVMLAQIDSDSTDVHNAEKYKFQIIIHDNDSISEYWLSPGKSIKYGGYNIALYQFSIDPQTSRYICLIQLSKRKFRWS